MDEGKSTSLATYTNFAQSNCLQTGFSPAASFAVSSLLESPFYRVGRYSAYLMYAVYTIDGKILWNDTDTALKILHY